MAGVHFATNCIKYMLLSGIFIYMIIPFLLVLKGFNKSVILKNFENLLEFRCFNPAPIAALIGMILLMVVIFGYIGAVNESALCDNLSVVILSVVLGLEMALSLFVSYATMDGDAETARTNTLNSLAKYNTDNVTYVAWNFVQSYLECCGVDGVEDWKNHEINGSEITIGDDTFQIPTSCCSYPNCETFYEQGCVDQIFGAISRFSDQLGIGAFCMGAVQLLGILFIHFLENAKARERIEITGEYEVV